MNYTKYLTMCAEWIPKFENNPEYKYYQYIQPQILKVLKFVEVESRRTSRGYENINSIVYVTDNADIIEGDLLDGYTVQTVTKYYDYNGNDNIGLYCYKCW